MNLPDHFQRGLRKVGFGWLVRCSCGDSAHRLSKMGARRAWRHHARRGTPSSRGW